METKKGANSICKNYFAVETRETEVVGTENKRLGKASTRQN